MKHHSIIKGKNILLRPICEEDIEQMRVWRNKEPIRKCFIYQKLISKEEQKRWYQNYLNLEDDRMFIIEYNQIKIGTAALYHIDTAKGEAEFGRIMIGEEDFKGKGIGKETVRLLCEFGFTTLHLSKIRLEVFTDNKPALHLYKQVGFNEIGVKNESSREIMELVLEAKALVQG